MRAAVESFPLVGPDSPTRVHAGAAPAFCRPGSWNGIDYRLSLAARRQTRPRGSGTCSSRTQPRTAARRSHLRAGFGARFLWRRASQRVLRQSVPGSHAAARSTPRRSSSLHGRTCAVDGRNPWCADRLAALRLSRSRPMRCSFMALASRAGSAPPGLLCRAAGPAPAARAFDGRLRDAPLGLGPGGRARRRLFRRVRRRITLTPRPRRILRSRGTGAARSAARRERRAVERTPRAIAMRAATWRRAVEAPIAPRFAAGRDSVQLRAARLRWLRSRRAHHEVSARRGGTRSATNKARCSRSFTARTATSCCAPRSCVCCAPHGHMLRTGPLI